MTWVAVAIGSFKVASETETTKPEADRPVILIVEDEALTIMDLGAVLELDRKVGEAIDIFVNNRLVARGEVVLVEERLGVTMTEIIKNDH